MTGFGAPPRGTTSKEHNVFFSFCAKLFRFVQILRRDYRVRDRFDWITFPIRFNTLFILYTVQYILRN